MDKMPPSIFNDVIGPVMRGASSSHVAGAARIAALVRQSLDGAVARAVCDFDVNGALAESHDGHGTDMGFVNGMVGKEITDRDAFDYWKSAERAGVEIEFRIRDYGAKHPNFYRIEATGRNGKSHRWDAVSVGGGMVEMVGYDGFPLSIAGDFYELLVTLASGGKSAADQAEAVRSAFGGADVVQTASRDDGAVLVQLKFASGLAPERLELAKGLAGVSDVSYLEPVLPIHSRADCRVPFLTAEELLRYVDSDDGKRAMWSLAALYESKRGGISEDEVYAKMSDLVTIMENCADEGLRGTEYSDRILGRQSDRIDGAAARLLPCGILNAAIKYITAIMEVKSSMGVIVAAPTAGSCGCLPGVLIGAGRTMGLTHEEITRGMLAAGLIGVFIAEEATFAAEVAGCQVECGAGSGMAAAGLVQLMGGTPAECVSAASMALQNITGLACDPVANRVEVPCLGKNVMGGGNAVASANMALAGYDKVIPLDQTIAAMYDAGLKLPLELRCTFGGLGKTPASLAIRQKLAAQKKEPRPSR